MNVLIDLDLQDKTVEILKQIASEQKTSVGEVLEGILRGNYILKRRFLELDESC